MVAYDNSRSCRRAKLLLRRSGQSRGVDLNSAYGRLKEPIDRPMDWEPSRTFLKYAVACLFAGCAAFLIAVIFFAPDQMVRAVGPIWIALAAAIAWILLSAGRVGAAVYVVGYGMWVAVTGLSIFFGGVRSTSVIIYPVIILLVGWLIGKRAAIVLAMLTVATTFVFVLGEAWGLLPLPAPAPAVLYWVVQSSAFIFSALLIVFLARSYQKRLEELDQLGSDLARRVAEVETAEAALRSSETQLQSILGATADGILAVDRLGKVMRINQRFAELWRIPDELLECKDDQRLLDHVLVQLDDPATFVNKVQALYQSDFQATDTLRFKDGRVFERFTAPFVSNGSVLGRIWSFRDITERKLALQALAKLNAELEARVISRTAELEHANEALQRSNMELQRYAYVAAHDLKTPLRSICSFVQLLQNSLAGKLDAQSDDWMRRITANSQRMDRMLQDALAFAQVDSKAQTFERVELSDTCHTALGWLHESIQRSRAQIACGPLPAALGDAQQLTQLFQNLIANAILYRGERAPATGISARVAGDHYVISVSDQGLGIEAAHHRRIFDLYFRLHAQPDYPGTGVGLAVCQRIVHRHHGHIWVESEPGKGSTFSFTLPILEHGRNASQQ